MDELVFLKLGGSLITEKTRRYTPRLERLASLAQEIRLAMAEIPSMRLVVGHGSGSFGHFAVQEHLYLDTPASPRDDGRRMDQQYWEGFAEVWYRASQLNRHVMDALHSAGVPAVALAPSAAVMTSKGSIVSWDLTTLKAALESDVLPVIFGDMVFDDVEGGKVLSTEVLMWHLARHLQPSRILLAGLESAVWADFPSRKVPIGSITPSTFSSWIDRIGASHGPDVTGGMKSKVTEMLNLVREIPGLSVQIFSGEHGGNIRRVLAGEVLGTVIASD